MGLLTGVCAPLRHTPRPRAAAVVSDAAAGGQVIMDTSTFKEVKERLVELGAVDHNGLSASKMHMSRPTLLQWLLGKRRAADDADVAVVLDM